MNGALGPESIHAERAEHGVEQGDAGHIHHQLGVLAATKRVDDLGWIAIDEDEDGTRQNLVPHVQEQRRARVLPAPKVQVLATLDELPCSDLVGGGDLQLAALEIPVEEAVVACVDDRLVQLLEVEVLEVPLCVELRGLHKAAAHGDPHGLQQVRQHRGSRAVHAGDGDGSTRAAVVAAGLQVGWSRRGHLAIGEVESGGAWPRREEARLPVTILAPSPLTCPPWFTTCPHIQMRRS